jgi:hypothetical protein
MFNVAILSTGKVDGSRADPGERLVSLSLLGGAELDFASAPTPPEVQVLIFNLLASTTVKVQPDQEVKLSGFGLFGSKTVDPPRPGKDDFALPLEVTAFSLLGGVSVKREDTETY